MKITNHDVIKAGEQELIDAITGELDWGALEELFEKNHRLRIGEDVKYKSGDIVIHNDQVAYRLEFDVNVTLSVLVDRNGSCLSLTSSADAELATDGQEDPIHEGIERPPADDPGPDDRPEASSGKIDPSELSEEVDSRPDSSEETDGSVIDKDEKNLSGDDTQKRIAQVASEARDMIEEINS